MLSIIKATENPYPKDRIGVQHLVTLRQTHKREIQKSSENKRKTNFSISNLSPFVLPFYIIDCVGPINWANKKFI